MKRMTVPKSAALLASGAALGMVFTGMPAPPVSVADPGGVLIPDPSPSIVPEAIPITPDGSLPYPITVIGTMGPVPGVIVEIEFSPEADALIAWGRHQAHPIMDGVTNDQGKVVFYITGAGCLDKDRYSFPTYVARVRGDGFVLGEPGVVNSPDAVTVQGFLPTDLGEPVCENGWMQVGLSDAVFHGLSISRGLNEPCSDFTIPLGNGVTLSDALILGPYISQGVTRPCQE